MQGVPEDPTPRSAQACWSGSPEELEQAIVALQSARHRWSRDQADFEDIVQNACLRFSRAVSKGVTIESPFVFLWTVWATEFAFWLRSKAARRRISGEMAQEPDAASIADVHPSPTEDQIRAAAAHLQEPLRSWFRDYLSGASDAELAARDGVSDAAIRRRWRRLRVHFEHPGFVEEFLDFALTNAAPRASLEMDAADSGRSPEPRAPSPEPRAPSPERW